MRAWLLLFVLAGLVSGEWSDDPGSPLNLGGGIQPQIASTSDGGAYVAWLTSGTFHIYLQRLDVNGNPQINTGGMLVSNAANSSWIAVNHMNLVVDQDDNAIISSVDTRRGNWEVALYKIDSDGNHLWVESGLILSNSGSDNISPRLLVEPSDNSVVVSWSEDYTSIRLQRVSQDGQLLWGPSGIAVSDLNASLVSPQPVKTSEGNILFQAIRQTGNFPALSSQITQQKYTLAGDPVWPAWNLIGAPAGFPLGNWLQNVSTDNQGGAYSSWTELAGQNQTGKIQRIEADGSEAWDSPRELSTQSDHFRVSPQISSINDSLGVYAAWGESDANQINRGLFAQRVDSSGARQWGDTGLAVESMGLSSFSDINVDVLDNDLLATYIEDTDAGTHDIYASRLAPDGAFVWEQDISIITNSGSEKADLFMAKGPNCAFLTWSEAGSIKVHCLLENGSLGAPVSPGSVIQVPGDYVSIQSAIDAAEAGDTVLVHPGTYVEQINFSGKDIVVGSLFLTSGDSSHITETVLDGDRAGTIVIFNSNEGPDAEMCGLTLQHGSASLFDPDGDGNSSSYGGAIYCENASPLLRHLKLINNWDLGGGGGGLFCYGSSPTLESVVFDGNVTGDVGGAIYAKAECNITITNSTFINNTCPSVGAAIYARDNTTLNLDRVLMVNNISDHAGGGIGLKAGSEAVLTNVTIADNFALHHGAGLYSNSSTYILVNTILWGNNRGEVYFADFDDPSEIILSHSTIQDSAAGITTNDNGTVTWLAGMLNLEPAFADTSNMDYSLTLNSPCVDAGTDLFVLDGETLLSIPESDIIGSAPEIGAFELTPEIMNYFPLSVGLQWTLESDIDTMVITVIDSSFLGRNLYYEFDAWYRYEDLNVFRTEGNQVYSRIENADQVLYDFAAFMNETWVFQDEDPGNSQMTLIRIDDTIETPLGVFDSCYGFHRFIGADYEYADYFAPDVGLVQRDVITFAGLRQYFLIDFARVTVGVDDNQPISQPTFRLEQNFPNPFNPSTVINYTLPSATEVSVVVYDVTGTEVAILQEGYQPMGHYIQEWSGTDMQGNAVAAGVYFCRVSGVGFSETIKMVLIK